MNVGVPANTKAVVRLPRGSQMTESGKALDNVEGLLSVAYRGQEAFVELSGGSYSFRIS